MLGKLKILFLDFYLLNIYILILYNLIYSINILKLVQSILFHLVMFVCCSSRQKSKPCGGTKFQYVENTIVCHDYQEIKIQESTQVLGVGAIPRSILVILKDDLVDVVKAGGIFPSNFHLILETILWPRHNILTCGLF